jgi:hypothetical protein
MSHVIDKLGKLFGSAARVKIMRLFLFNPETIFDLDDIAGRAKVSRIQVRKEVTSLIHAEFLKKKSFKKDVPFRTTTRKKTVVGYMANPAFDIADPLRTLLIESELVRVQDLPKRFIRAGRMHLFVVSGIFMHDHDRMLDMMIVGDRLRRPAIDQAIRVLESEIGREIRYAVFDKEEYDYRSRMYDKLLRDVFEYPHQKLINRIEKA